MEIIQEMGKSYLCVDIERSSASEYPERMLTDNEIKGQPVCRRGISSNRDVLKYDITNIKNLIREYDSRSMHFGDISKLLLGIADQLMRGAAYLLDEKMYVFDPEYIYVDMETEELNMICIPYRFKDDQAEDKYHELADFLLDKIDHKDEKAVSIAYQFYRMSKEKLFSMIGFCSVIEKEAGEINIEKEHYREERNVRNDPEKHPFGNDDFDKEKSLYDELNELGAVDQKKKAQTISGKRPVIIKPVRIPLILGLIGISGFLYYVFSGMNSTYGIQILSVSVLISIIAAILGIRCVVRVLKNREERELEKDMSECSATVGEYWGADEGTVFFDEETQFFDPEEGESITVEWNENGEERRRKIEGDCVVIGKKFDEVDLCISDPTVSRKHAQMTVKSGEVFLRDLGSTNGTYVEGRKLNPGEDIKLYNNKDFLLGKVAVRVV